uniref:Uncharacterized protein n=1 Tax=Acrobeloides nanus TaxID=290746 RepID=A0A914DPY5_9BILA
VILAYQTNTKVRSPGSVEIL